MSGIFGKIEGANPSVDEDGQVRETPIDTGDEENLYFDFEGRGVATIVDVSTGFNDSPDKKVHYLVVELKLEKIYSQRLHEADTKTKSEAKVGRKVTEYNELPRASDPDNMTWREKRHLKSIRQIAGAVMQIDHRVIHQDWIDDLVEDDGAPMLGEPIGFKTAGSYSEDKDRVYYNASFYPVEEASDGGYERIEPRGLDDPEIGEMIREANSES